MVHEKNILSRYFDAINDGAKTFEIRKDDPNIKLGDILKLKEWDGKGTYTGWEMDAEIVYVLRDVYDYGLRDGYVIYGIKKKGVNYVI